MANNSNTFTKKPSDPRKLFFVALLPPTDLQVEITEIKQYFAREYQSSHALKSPPHITLYPPFKWLPENLPQLNQCLCEFAANYAPIPVTLDGFGAFAPRVIFIHPLKTPELMTLQGDLMGYLASNLGLVDERSKNQSFAPHITVAFKDLTPSAFKAAWPKFRVKRSYPGGNRPFWTQFSAHNLTLLIHDRQRWNICSEFPFLQ